MKTLITTLGAALFAMTTGCALVEGDRATPSQDEGVQHPAPRQTPSRFEPAPEIETRSLNELYEAAKEEGGNLVLWLGGDKKDQADYYLDMFKKAYPDIHVTHTIDLSMYHAGRFDTALEKGSDVPDVIQLQTLYDYHHWAPRGELISYKPKDWDKVRPAAKDPHGYWTGVFGVSFTNVVNTDLIAEDRAPRDARDYLDPALKGQLILTYPHSDDAVLYQFWHLKQKYGWGYLEKLIANEPVWVRGTSMPYVAISKGWYPASFTTSWAFVPFPGSPVKLLLPKDDFFLSWFQTAAIPSRAKNKASAKLYLNWMLSKNFQSKWLQWPVRTDVEAPGGYGHVEDHNTAPDDFHRFMLDRDGLERFRFRIEQLVGRIEGVSPLEMDYSTKPTSE